LSKTKCLAFTDDCRWFRNLKASVSLFASVRKRSEDDNLANAHLINSAFWSDSVPEAKLHFEVGSCHDLTVDFQNLKQSESVTALVESLLLGEGTLHRISSNLLALSGESLPPVTSRDSSTQGLWGRGDHSVAFVPRVTTSKAILLKHTVLTTGGGSEHSHGTDHLPTSEQGRGATDTRPAAASTWVGQLDDVPPVEALVAMFALGFFGGPLSTGNASCLTSLQAGKVVLVATTAAIDELLALASVVVEPWLQGSAGSTIHWKTAWIRVLLSSRPS